MADQLQQRQVVARVRIEPGVGQLAIVSFQQVEQTQYLAFAIGEGAEGAAGVVSVEHFEIDGEDFVDADPRRDRLDQVHPGCGDDQHPVVGAAVARQAGAGVAVDQRLDDLLDVGLHFPLDFLDAATDQRLQGVVHVQVHGQLAFGVLLHQFGVAADEGFVDPAETRHALAPQAGAVAVDHGLVQVEDHQAHQATSRILLRSMTSVS